MKMEVAMEPAGSIPLAGFWQRAFALTVDAFVVHIATALVGLMLFQPTHGAVRIAEIPLGKSRVCASVTVDRNTLALPAELAVSRAAVCVSSVLGLVHDRWLEVTDQRQSGSVTSIRAITLPLDETGRVMRAVYLDYLWIFILAFYLLVLEGMSGTTLGKRVLGVQIRSPGRGRPTLAAVCRRLIIRFLPILPVVPLVVVAMASGPMAVLLLWSRYWLIVMALCAVSAVTFVVLLVNFVSASINDDLPWHDRWAGTEAVTPR
jgi:uncharacterized RDD family membrane protein YckC